MGVAVVYPSATLLGLTWLRAQLPAAYTGGPVVVAGKVPNPRPADPLVVLRRAGGLPDAALRDRPRIDAQVWHVDEPRAEQLAETVRAVLKAARGVTVDGVTIGRTADFLSPVPVPDPESGAARYLLTVEWQIPGTQLGATS